MSLHVDTLAPPPPPWGCLRTKRGALRVLIQHTEPGKTFDTQVVPPTVHDAAKSIGARVSVRKLETGGWRVWRL